MVDGLLGQAEGRPAPSLDLDHDQRVAIHHHEVDLADLKSYIAGNRSQPRPL
jgi:hypothetical protein